MFLIFSIRLERILAVLITWNLVLSTNAFATDFMLNLPKSVGAAIELALPYGLTDPPSKVLQVFVGTEEEYCETKTPIAGRYTYENEVLSFTPAFEFSAGQHYLVRIQDAKSTEFIAFRMTQDSEMQPAAVTAIFPGGETLPENTLRFYIHFSRPMKPHVALEYIKLRDASGKVDEAAFMKFKQELWNEDRTQLTILVDPGRIKREVATNRMLGPALISNHRYELVVEPGWPAADGKSVLTGFSKSFLVTEALREKPNVELWSVTTPQLGTRKPLSIEFDRPFDHQLLSKELVVGVEGGQKINGEIEIGDDEVSWHFTPNKAWTNENVLIVVSSFLEDVAGNNFQSLLDHRAGLSSQTETFFTVPAVLKRQFEIPCHNSLPRHPDCSVDLHLTPKHYNEPDQLMSK